MSALTLEQVRALLEGAGTGPWFVDEATVRDSTGHGVCRLDWEDELGQRIYSLLHDGNTALLAAAPDLARLVLSLAAELEAARAQAAAVAGLPRQWDGMGQMLRSNVPNDYAERNARDFHALGRAGALSDCAVGLMTALAQASAGPDAEGAGT